MRKLLAFAALLLSCSVLQAQWEPDFNHAKETAAGQHKNILLVFSGSDWCGPCIMFRKEYLDNPAFLDFSAKNLMLVNADFPRKSKNRLPDELAKRNAALAETYNKQGNFPYTLLLDADGKILKTWTGKPEMPLDAWISEVQKSCRL